MFGITKANGLYWVSLSGGSSKIGFHTYRGAIAHIIFGI